MIGEQLGEYRILARLGSGGFGVVYLAEDVRRYGERVALKVLGVVAYRYELDSRELWENGLLVSLDGTTNDDGDRETARVRREGDRLVSSGTHVGDMPGDAATTTYWTPAFLERSTWISTQTGAPLRVSASQDGSEAVPGPSGALTCTRWQVSGDLDLALYYDDRGEWTQHWDEEVGSHYYFNSSTGEATWVQPELEAIAD